MKEHPILFSGPMISALLANRKHVTRRLSKQWLKVKAGDRLWVRETLRRPDGDPWLYDVDRQPVMVAQEDETAMLVWAHHKDQDYCPSIFMPRWASRILLECEEDAREERLQDITEEECLLEGMLPLVVTQADIDEAQSGDDDAITKLARALGPGQFTAKCEFMMLWSQLHTKPGERWEDNPEVVRVGRFRRIA